MTYKTLIHDVDTNEIIERDATEEEIATIENMRAKREAINAEAEAKAFAKADLLAKLGITEDEAKLLLG
jgi:hypothetical protein